MADETKTPETVVQQLIRKLPKEQIPQAEIDLEERILQRAMNETQTRERALRTWFIAYGVGAPAVLIMNDVAFDRVTQSVPLGIIAAISFGLGVAIQIGTEICIKWKYRIYFYRRIECGEAAGKPLDCLRCRAHGMFGVDIVTALLFLAATILVACILWGSRAG